jgi:type I restriction enzyme R subunit
MTLELPAALEAQRLTTERLWNAYNYAFPAKVKSKSPINMTMDIVSLLKFELKISGELRTHSEVVNYNFKQWIFAKNAGPVHFSNEQTEWLQWVRDFIANSLAICPDDLNLDPFNRHGGQGRFYALFGDGYEALLNEMNTALVA